MRIFRIGVVLFLSLVVTESLLAQGGSNVQFIGQMRTRGTSNYAQVWGYNASNGKEYAILGTQDGTQIVDITGDTLKEVAFIPGPPTADATFTWREMKVYQHYAYVVTEGNGAGLQIIDLDSMKLVNTITTTQVPSGHTISIEGKYLYISGGRYKSGGIVVLDLADPVNPKYAGEYQFQNEYVHDCVIYNDTIYAAAIFGQGIDIIDATNKAAMKRVSITNYPYSGTHNTDVSTDKKFVFSTDEVNSNPNNNGNLLRVWDRTDVTNLKLVASYVARPQTIVHNIHVKGNYGYLAHYSEGLRILDLKYPEIPVEVAHYDTYVGSENKFVGAWGVFPYFNSNKVAISDITGGLFVIRFDGQNGSVKAARAVVTVLDSATNLPISEVQVTLPGRFDTLITDANGKVKFGAVTDTLTATFFKSAYNAGYTTVIKKIVMQYDTLISITVKLKQKVTGSLTVNVTNKTTTQPVKNFKLSITKTPVSGLTDALGIFTVPSLIGGTMFTVVAAQWGYIPEFFDVNIVGGTNNILNAALTPQGVDGFEDDLGWTVGSPVDSGSSGKWQRTDAVAAVVGSDTLQPSKDHSAIGTKYFVTGASSSAADNVDFRTTLTSPVFGVSGFAHPALLYWVYFNSRSSVKDDTLYVYLSNDQGMTWKQVNTVTGKQPFWKQYRIAIDGELTPTDQMRVRFVAKDGGVSSVFDAAIDDVEFGNDLQLSVEREGNMVPSEFALMQNFPNPFNPSTNIEFSLPLQSFVSLKIYDIVGREVAQLLNEQVPAGRTAIEWNGTNSGGQHVESGVYFYTVKAGEFVQTRKMILLK